MRAARVVAADARLGGAPEVERRRELVRVRAGGRVDDRMRPVDDLELVVAPRRAARRPRARCSRPRPASRRAPRRASAASKTSWIISQSPSCVLLKSLKSRRTSTGARACPGAGLRARRARRPSGLRARREPLRPAARSRSPGRAHRPGSRGGTRSGRRGPSPTGAIFTRSVRFHGPRSATVGSSKRRSTSIGIVRLAGAALLASARRAARPGAYCSASACSSASSAAAVGAATSAASAISERRAGFGRRYASGAFSAHSRTLDAGTGHGTRASA